MVLTELNAGVQLTNTIVKNVVNIFNKVNEETDLAICFNTEKIPNKADSIVKMYLYNNSERMNYNINVLNCNGEKVVNTFFVPSKHMIEIEVAYVVKMPMKTFVTMLNDKKTTFNDNETFIFDVDGKQYRVYINFKEIVKLGSN